MLSNTKYGRALGGYLTVLSLLVDMLIGLTNRKLMITECNRWIKKESKNLNLFFLDKD